MSEEPDRAIAVESCLVCAEIAGDVDVPGGVLIEDDHVLAIHVPPREGRAERPYLGHLLVVTRRHVARFGDLDEDEAAAVGRTAARLAHALISAVIGTGVPHFHLHLLPRYPGTPSDVAWHTVDEWEGGPHGDAAEIAEFATLLRVGLSRWSLDAAGSSPSADSR